MSPLSLTWMAQLIAGYSQVRPGARMRHAGPQLNPHPRAPRSKSVADITISSAPTETPLASLRCGPVTPSLLDRLTTISRASALEEMASGIAHELNQPLGAIVTFAQA